MKRKIYFIVSSVVQIILSIYLLFNIKDLVQELANQLKNSPYGKLDRVNDLINNSGQTYFGFIIIISIIISLFFIYLALKNKLLKKKGSVIAFSIILFFTSMKPISELIAIVNIIVICLSKPINDNDYPDKKEKMPILKKEAINEKKILLAIILLSVYFSQFLWKQFIPDNDMIRMLVSIIFYLIMIVLSLIFFKDLLKNNFKVYKEHIKSYFQNLIRSIGIFYFVYFIIAMIAVLLSKGNTSINQENVEALPLWFSFPLAIIYAPIVEETLFRGCLRRLVKNDKVFIVVSALAFGLLHTIFTEISLYNAVVIALPYMAIGGFLAYLYVKTNNICTNMVLHSCHNTVAMIISLLIRGI